MIKWNKIETNGMHVPSGSMECETCFPSQIQRDWQSEEAENEKEGGPLKKSFQVLLTGAETTWQFTYIE